ncbi:ParB/RepB/Spo0J family partition protein [Streptomyces candidus]|uniref:ParB family chromosome partitioning protein n=1 Tax=Streptomyces candidus TaxID=67283 RepID=A0A7X0LSC4_9ACTN|nr:ParB/RepB/Spo0J family partition protein [Streptomyces candidus]MBB6439110.1 ParB family chromosome partitioning protein [Streptomyces candidus]GHH55686.1 plasmid partitioning protein [Streptomyces candidus]
MTSSPQRVTRGFDMDEEGENGASPPPPRRIRTRQQIIAGEGKRPPAAVDLAQLAHNPFNPRDELTDVEETGASLKERGQLQPIAVVRRAAFLAVHNDQADAIGNAEYVVIDGNRRLAGARSVGLPQLRIDVNDDLAVSAADMLESALIANIHRVDVPPIDQAKAIQQLKEVHGSQNQVAKRLGKTPAWVSQRLALLELTPELQERVEAGELKVEPARRIGRLPKEQQAAEAAKAVNAVNTPRQRSDRKASPEPATAKTVNAVNTPAAVPAPTPAFSDGNAQAQTAKTTDSDRGMRPEPIDWSDPEAVAALVCDRMTLVHRKRLASILLLANKDG